MEIPLNAQVECIDGVCGLSEFVLIDPIHDQVTHIVVKENMYPNAEYIVPVDKVDEILADRIQLHCDKAELEKMKPFIQTQYIQVKVPERYSSYSEGSSGMGSSYYMPYTIPDRTVYEKEEIQQIPPGEFTVSRGAHVEATDGMVGKVDEFVINPETGNITHLVMREGHLWGHKDVIIPLSALGETHEDTVFLKLDKQQIESLPTFPIHRLWE